MKGFSSACDLKFVGKYWCSAIFSFSLPAAFTKRTPLLSAYLNASQTTFLPGETGFPKLILSIFAPLSTAYLTAFATSLSLSSPSGTALTVIIFATLDATPYWFSEPFTNPAMIPATCVPCFASGPS